MSNGHMHAVSISLEPTESVEMAYDPPVECPLCGETLEPDRTLENHLVITHPEREVARYLASLQEYAEPWSVSD